MTMNAQILQRCAGVTLFALVAGALGTGCVNPEAASEDSTAQALTADSQDKNGLGHAHVGGTFIQVCDDAHDNHGVYATYWWSTASQFGSGEVSDHNGGDAGCGTTNAPGDIYKFQLCIRLENTL